MGEFYSYHRNGCSKMRPWTAGVFTMIGSMSSKANGKITSIIIEVVGCKEYGMRSIQGHSLVMVCCAVLVAGWAIFPVTAAVCDGPPNSQSFILFTGGCDRSSSGLPCTQGFLFPAQPSPGGDYPTQYYLDFGDGYPPYYGTVDAVTHAYTTPGRFTLKYMAGTQCDLWRQATYVLTITAPENGTPVIPACPPSQPQAEFIGSPTSGFAPLPIQFTSTSSGSDAYFWRFGDGGTSPARDPKHTYTKAGIYTVSLEARDSCTGTASRAEKLSYISVTTTLQTLTVSSTPTGAMVFIDNVAKGITPVTLTDTSIGTHQLLLSKSGFDDYTRSIVIEPSTPVTVGATLRKSLPESTIPPSASSGSIAITSSPAGAMVFVDGIHRGTTPVILSEIPTGNHRVTLSFKGYDDWNHTVSVGSGQMAAINAELDAIKEITGSLAVITDPSGAEVFIDGNFKGVSPVTIQGLSTGMHSVLLTMQEYADNSSAITVSAGQTQKYTAGLKKVYKPSASDLLLAGGAMVLIALIAIVVIVRNDRKSR
jgi:PKD repeat protein